jgi:hypothetical protein
VTFKVTVFDVGLPFLGVTVTVTLQDPAFSPLRVAPDTLQNFDELDTTFNLTFEVEGTLSLANVAIDFAETVLDIVTLGIALDVVIDPMAAISGGLRVVDVVVDTGVTGTTAVEDGGTAGSPAVFGGDGDGPSKLCVHEYVYAMYACICLCCVCMHMSMLCMHVYVFAVYACM